MLPFLSLSRAMNLAQHRLCENSLDRARTQFEVEQDLLRGLLYGTAGPHFLNYLHGGNSTTKQDVDTGVPFFRQEKLEELIDAMVAANVPLVGWFLVWCPPPPLLATLHNHCKLPFSRVVSSNMGEIL